MKKSIQLIVVGSIMAVSSVTFVACNKTINETQKSAYTPASLDEKAGTWKTYVLASPTEIAVAEPKAINSAEYLAEVASLKQKSSSLTSAQQDAVTYWGAGAAFRWNEIGRELCARYNIPPASTPDGKYPVPDAANPLADPRFPFANPPYTSRALAYLSVAQYDALVSAWHYKYLYNRVAPAKTDATLKPLLPVTTLPSYPSEDAVVAAASVVILKAMFPGEVAFLDAKLAEHRNSRLWAGMNVESDLVAGETLGSAVAAKVMGRAKTDGMSAANNQTVTAGMIQAAKERGLKEVWVSQETPARPPMLPNFGAVKPWNLETGTLAKVRPPAPPDLASDAYKKDLAELSQINKGQTRDQARVANFWADGPGSYTPPGHWHRTAANTAHDALFSEVRMARTLALVGTTEMDAGIACWDAKYYYYFPRPQQFGMKTSVGLPNFPSYPSGHSTFSGAAATVLSYIFPDKAQVFETEASEASLSRVYGLIHYRFDAEKGIDHGKVIGSYAVARGKADGSGL
ncbi:phosphatase PAP2 family protein [Spirosoma sp. KNUC1025]|uniref:phosphatase PAP2 family protein n=1 Tax=Spirosoma sp. KNUC1025 TaxID=2894082 RepID=UPI003869BBE0|nr:phosphatase PAP2 family protein [Spirosoma sp. KNUC1025]